jgi:putative endonuclease
MRREWHFAVYIMASKSRQLYTGMTNDLHNRVFQHKNDLLDGFTKQYKIHRLVYFENYSQVINAINREKEIKGWRREKKIALIKTMNPTWDDLAEHWYDSHRYAPEQQVPRRCAPRDDTQQSVEQNSNSLVTHKI